MSSSSALPPLDGLKVLELARILAGPWAGQLLADLGADVIKVERPGTGDETRRWGPPFIPAADGGHLHSAYFQSCNRGKRSVAIDFQTEEGRAEVRRLAAEADVLIENFKVGTLCKYGLDSEALRALNPRLIYCSITGFGQTGPYSNRAGYDFIIQGMSGFMDITGEAEGEPMKAGVAFADIFTGVYAVVGILAALRRRDETGNGAVLDLALLDTMTGVLANQALNYFITGLSPTRMGNAHPNLVPYQVFPTMDGPIIIAVGSDAQFRKLCQALGVSDLADNPLYATNEDRVNHRSELIPLLVALTSEAPQAGLLDRLHHFDVPAGRINSIGEAFEHPQICARGMRITTPHPQDAGTMIAGVALPILIDGVRLSSRYAPEAVSQERVTWRSV
jgi:crotonobetainyl-CoA:carnitine CoA-transferase CaiB-like acyl-CoA transferase